jgi:hypothetical protein
VRGFPQAKHLVYLVLLEEGDGGVDFEETKDAGEAVLHLHGALPFAMGVLMEKARGEECSRGAFGYRWARGIRVLVREGREIRVGVSV